MLAASFAILSLAVALGACMLAGRVHRLALLHGLAGACGVALLVAGLVRRGHEGSFALDAAVLTGGALMGGLLLALLSLRRRAPPDWLIVVHASVGGLGYMILAGVFLAR